VLVEINSSAILVEPIKNHSKAKLTHAYFPLMSHLHKAGVAPCKHVLDNKIPTTMKTLITEKYKMAYELVPPGCHFRNAAKVAIQNFKAHFLSGLLVLLTISLSNYGTSSNHRQNHHQLAPTVQFHSFCLCLCTPQWTIRLQQNVIGTYGVQGPSTEKTDACDLTVGI